MPRLNPESVKIDYVSYRAMRACFKTHTSLFIEVMWKVWIHEIWSFSQIYLFFKFTLEKDAFDIHLIHINTFMSNIRKKDMHPFQSSNICISHFIIDAFKLAKTMSHKSCLVKNDGSRVINFVSEYPPNFDYFLFSWFKN